MQTATSTIYHSLLLPDSYGKGALLAYYIVVSRKERYQLLVHYIRAFIMTC